MGLPVKITNVRTLLASTNDVTCRLDSWKISAVPHKTPSHSKELAVYMHTFVRFLERTARRQATKHAAHRPCTAFAWNCNVWNLKAHS
jgi:hypothetical protein